MKAPPKPSNDKQRLEALYKYNILDTPAETIFDLIASIASIVCQTPIGQITLIDENRLWFKANIGMPGDSEVSRDISFCSHTILQPDLLEIQDAKTDERFHDNPYVADDPYIRFYAGMPLADADGFRLGAICVIDKQPRKLNTEQKEILQKLSDVVIKLFEQKKSINDHWQQLKNIESELRQQKIFNEQILNSALNGIVTFDKKGHIITVNPALTKLFHYGDDELNGQNVKLILPAFDFTQCEEKLYETKGLTKTSDDIIVELFISSMQNNGEILHVGFLRDITQFKEVERMKNEFISITSHELRTPLTAIQGALELIKNGDISLEEKEDVDTLLDVAINNCKRLIRLINDILDIKKIESGKIELDLKVLQLDAAIQEAIDANAAFADKFTVKIIFAQRLKNIKVLADHDRLIQVITNLLSNAIKFSPKNSSVKIAMVLKDNNIEVSISDQGPGIPDEFKSRIFQKFSQANKHQSGSSGLGLAISKSIVEELKGSIGFATTLNKGTTFYFILPIYTSPQEPKKLDSITHS